MDTQVQVINLALGLSVRESSLCSPQGMSLSLSLFFTSGGNQNNGFFKSLGVIPHC